MLASAITILAIVISQFIALTASSAQYNLVASKECRDNTSIYIIEVNSSGIVVENATCNDGYISINLQLNESICPHDVTIIKHGVSISLAVTSNEEEGRCFLLVSTEGLSPLRLAPDESMVIDVGLIGQITVLRKQIINNTTSTEIAQTSGSSVYIPNDTNEKEGEVRSNKMSGVDLSPVEIAGAIALMALTILAAVKEYGPGRKGG